MTIDHTRGEYAEFSNAVAGALIEYAEAEGLPRPVFSARYRTAARAWRELHPDSLFGDEFGPWPALPEATPGRVATSRYATVPYETALDAGATPPQYAEWAGRKLWAMYGSGECRQ